MFPSVKTRFASAARRSFDLALEFATLGEYGLGEAAGLPEEGTDRRGPSRRARPARKSAAREHAAPAVNVPAPAAEQRARPRATRLRPATPAARRLRPEAPLQRISARTGMRALALDAHGSQGRRGGRQRAGSARPQPQPCLVGDAGGSAPMDS
jgi:hypothetical protein